MKLLLPSFFLLAIVTASLQAGEPPELEKLRGNYRQALNRVTLPVHDTYLAELRKLQDRYTREANLEAAMAVKGEIDAIVSSIQKSALEGAPVAPLPDRKGETLAVIPANSYNGHVIGPVRKGTVLSLTYQEGKWKDRGHIPTEDPDAETNQYGDATRLVIAEGGEEKPGRVLAIVPSGTAQSAYLYTFTQDVENVVLRINKNSADYETNPGSVTYRLSFNP